MVSKAKMTAFRASLHAPSSLACNTAESDNSSEDELPFDENIPLAGYKEQDEEEDEEAIGGFSEEIGIAAIKLKETSNNNILLTVKRKRIFCSISFLRLL